MGLSKRLDVNQKKISRVNIPILVHRTPDLTVILLTKWASLLSTSHFAVKSMV